jgi:DNA-binding NtrC family response regulator
LRPTRILLVDDDKHLRLTLGPHLEDLGHEVAAVESAEKALDRFLSFKPDIVFSDVQMPGMDGFELLSRLRETGQDVDIIIITGYGGVQGAIDAIRDGATDYLLKPLDLDEIEAVIERCVGDRHQRQGSEPDDTKDLAPAPGGLVGRHPSMLAVYKTIGAVSATKAPVLLRGETGTGKELIARTIHESSPQATQPFIAINCAAVPESLLESTLFGHVKGAFTGASSDRKGPFELAGKGTVFLDEIGDTSLALQAKFLRVLEQGEFYAVGSEQPQVTQARVIAATNQDLEMLVREGGFRDDLLFRLRVIEIRIPPLRERATDIPLLVRHFLAKAADELGRQPPGVSREVMGHLLAQDWPGNVRELENTLTRALVMARGNSLSLHDLEGDHWTSPAGRKALGVSHSHQSKGVSPPDGLDSLAAVERQHVQRVLTMTKGNKSEAARILKVSRPTLNRMIKEYDLVVP